MKRDRLEAIGRYFVAKWRARLHATGGDTQKVAAQMRKQGIPLEIALEVLCAKDA